MEQPICLVGIGKIAVDQHVPAIANSPDWTLAATVSRAGTVDGVPSYSDFDAMLVERDDIRTVSLCLPPVPRYDYAVRAIAAGRNVMLEKTARCDTGRGAGPNHAGRCKRCDAIYDMAQPHGQRRRSRQGVSGR